MRRSLPTSRDRTRAKGGREAGPGVYCSRRREPEGHGRLRGPDEDEWMCQKKTEAFAVGGYNEFVPDLQIHSFPKELNTYYVPSAPGAAWQPNPFPCVPFIRRGHSGRKLQPRRGPSRQHPRLTRRVCTTAYGPPDGWMERRTWRGLLSTCQTAPLRSRIYGGRGAGTSRQVGKPGPSPHSCSAGVGAAAPPAT